jgi:hypothetical protein
MRRIVHAVRIPSTIRAIGYTRPRPISRFHAAPQPCYPFPLHLFSTHKMMVQCRTRSTRCSALYRKIDLSWRPHEPCAPYWRLSESEVDFEEMQVHTDFVRTICASIREMLEAVLYKEPRNDFKTGANSADDSDRAPKVPACEFIVAEKGRSRAHVN